MDKVAVFAASDLRQATVFGLGIMPYISASIIFQLLGSVWKPIEELRKEGETGRKKINEYTRYLTVFLCFIQSWFYVRFYLMSSPAGGGAGLIDVNFLSNPLNPGSLYFNWQITAVLTMTCGTIFLMWLGEQIDEFGIGNGISLLIMAGILARMPGALVNLFQNAELQLVGLSASRIGVETLIVLGFLFVAVVFGVVFITLGQRRIPTQSAKHVRGRRVYGGTRQYLPLRINQAGVMPIIFASSLLMLPAMFFNMAAGARLRIHVSLDRVFLRDFPPRYVVHIQHAVRGADLLLLLLLDGHHLQSERDVRELEGLRHLHSGLSAGQTDCRLPGKGDGPHHLRWGWLPGSGGDRANGHLEFLGCQF